MKAPLITAYLNTISLIGSSVAMFKKIEIYHWRQFEKVEIELDDRVTIITGSNGAGKTTILNILGKNFGWKLVYYQLPPQIKNQA